MAAQLDHLMVPARDKIAAAKRLAEILGVIWAAEGVGPFAPVYVNDGLTSTGEVMQALSIFLRLLAPVFLAVAALHLVLGIQADAMLGTVVTPEMAREPSLASPNRFDGVSVAVSGVVMFLCAGDLRRYAPILRALLVVFFCAGLARFVAWATLGAPAPMVVWLLVSELVLPPVLWWWLRRALRDA